MDNYAKMTMIKFKATTQYTHTHQHIHTVSVANFQVNLR